VSVKAKVVAERDRLEVAEDLDESLLPEDELELEEEAVPETAAMPTRELARSKTV
jgi:hypothetical protein